ncbi:hypothetical protein FOA52_001308 [Chlamydomonas sp. UWO 241]|nr:hypothetical protein FOA52_001308 [Chlamydomonas sp. UWO 241]
MLVACVSTTGVLAAPLWRWGTSRTGHGSSASSSGSSTTPQPGLLAGTAGRALSGAGRCMHTANDEPLDNYTWFAPEHLRQRAQVSAGDTARMRMAMDRHARGEPLKVVFLGGSITAGQGNWGDGLSFPAWAEAVFNASIVANKGAPNVKVHNGAVPGTLSSYMSVCHNIHTPKDADIIFVDYSVNDDWEMFPPMNNGVRRPFERLLRKLLNYPKRPAVVLVHAYVWHSVLPPSGKFWASSERDHHEFGSFYGLPQLSVKAALWETFQQDKLPGFRTHRTRSSMHGSHQPELDDQLRGQVFYWDLVHPDGLTGHRFMGEMVATLVLDALASVRASPITDSEREAVARPIPPPMLPDNFESPSDKCFIGPAFLAAVASHDGWEYRDEGKDPDKPKLGYISELPGSRLRFKVSTKALSFSPVESEKSVIIELSYLKSYVNMGQAAVRCVGGCTCDESRIDGHNDEKNSQLHLHEFKATQADECLIEIEVLGETRSGHHKVKISAIIISEEAGMAGVRNDLAVNMVMEGANKNSDGNFDIRTWGRRS